MAVLDGAWPIVIVEDRYGGTYSGGGWLAIAGADELAGADLRVGVNRAGYVLGDEGPHGEDLEAMEFWANPPEWIAVGDTPDKALAALKAKLEKADDRRSHRF